MNHTSNVHPGLVLEDELEECGITQTQLANHIGVLPKTINEICRGKRCGNGRATFTCPGRVTGFLAELAKELGTKPGGQKALSAHHKNCSLISGCDGPLLLLGRRISP